MVVLGIAAVIASAVSAAAQEVVSITVPSTVGFMVSDVSRATSGANSTTISFSTAILVPGRALRVSVKADAAAFTPPSGSGIPSAKVTWVTTGATGGTGSNGALSSLSFVLVFQSQPLTLAGHVDLAWTLAAPGSGIRAGNHQLTIRWKVESVIP
jgi:hypothetical protein